MRQHDIRLLQITSPSQMEPYLVSAAKAYREVYTTTPYSEQFYPEEAQSIIRQHVKIHGQITLLAIKDEEVIGFGLGSPVQCYPEITRQIRGLLPIRNTFYFAELGLLTAHRRIGIGRLLTEERIKLVDSLKYQHIVLRTSHIEDPAYKLFRSMNFEDMGVYTEISSRRTDGTIRTDRRIFLSRLLSQS